MRNITLTLLACLCATLITSCSKESLNTNERDSGGAETIYSPYFFTGILKPQAMKVVANNGNGYELGKTDRTSLLVELSGERYAKYSNATFDEFVKLAELKGDTPQGKKYAHATPVDNETIEFAISKVSVKALSAYNETHPEGSSLMDVIRIRFESFDHIFDKALNPKNFGSANHARYTIEPGSVLSPIKHLALNSGVDHSLAMSLEFAQAPSTPQQRLLITLTFENGLELKEVVDVNILEQNK